jgi:tetratricopeptide (TPR) repeat protein
MDKFFHGRPVFNVKTVRYFRIKAFFACALCVLLAASLDAQTSSFIATGVKSEALSRSLTRVTWTLPKENPESIHLYMGNVPFRNAASLNDDTLFAVLPPHITEYFDKTANAYSHFYAIIAVFDGVPFELLIPSINATSNLPIASAMSQDIVVPDEQNERVYGNRTIPLPPLTDTKAKKFEIPADLIEAAPEPPQSAFDQNLLAPYIFPQEQMAPLAGENFLLYDIVSRDFAAGNYARALEQLDDLLRVKRSAALTNRAEFYRGECQYFLGDYRAAMGRFLFTKPTHPELSNRWLDSSLDNMKIRKKEGR